MGAVIIALTVDRNLANLVEDEFAVEDVATGIGGRGGRSWEFDDSGFQPRELEDLRPSPIDR